MNELKTNNTITVQSYLFNTFTAHKIPTAVIVRLLPRRDRPGGGLNVLAKRQKNVTQVTISCQPLT